MTMEELHEFADSPEIREDFPRLRQWAPPEFTDHEVCFILACANDDLDPDEWIRLFEECIGKTDQEVYDLVQRMTAPE